MLAEHIGLVDNLVEGRLEVGFGRGASSFQFSRFALTEDSAAARLQETLNILLGVWGADADFA